MKEEVLEIVRAQLMGAKDNLYRANMEFGKMTPEELDKEHGQSGRKRGDILAGYQDREAELNKCVDWVNAH